VVRQVTDKNSIFRATIHPKAKLPMKDTASLMHNLVKHSELKKQLRGKALAELELADFRLMAETINRTLNDLLPKLEQQTVVNLFGDNDSRLKPLKVQPPKTNWTEFVQNMRQICQKLEWVSYKTLQRWAQGQNSTSKAHLRALQLFLDQDNLPSQDDWSQFEGVYELYYSRSGENQKSTLERALLALHWEKGLWRAQLQTPRYRYDTDYCNFDKAQLLALNFSNRYLSFHLQVFLDSKQERLLASGTLFAFEKNHFEHGFYWLVRNRSIQTIGKEALPSLENLPKFFEPIRDFFSFYPSRSLSYLVQKTEEIFFVGYLSDDKVTVTRFTLRVTTDWKAGEVETLDQHGQTRNRYRLIMSKANKNHYFIGLQKIADENHFALLTFTHNPSKDYNWFPGNYSSMALTGEISYAGGLWLRRVSNAEEMSRAASEPTPLGVIFEMQGRFLQSTKMTSDINARPHAQHARKAQALIGKYKSIKLTSVKGETYIQTSYLGLNEDGSAEILTSNQTKKYGHFKPLPDGNLLECVFYRDRELKHISDYCLIEMKPFGPDNRLLSGVVLSTGSHNKPSYAPFLMQRQDAGQWVETGKLPFSDETVAKLKDLVPGFELNLLLPSPPA